MIKAINFWSFPGGLEGTKNVNQAIKEARILGYEGIELSFGDAGTLSPSTTGQEISDILKTAKVEKIKISSLCAGFYWGYNFASSKAEERKKAVEMTKKYIDTAEALGVDKILVIPGAVDVFFNPAAEIISYDDVYSRCVTALEQWVRILGTRIKAVHFKDFRRESGNGGMTGFVDLLSGDVNWPEVVKALKETGYSGPVTAEMIPYYKYFPEVRLKVTSIAMDAILGRK